MPSTLVSPDLHASIQHRADELFRQHEQGIFKSTDRLFAGLMLAQWIASIFAALYISPLTWQGTQSQTHIHVWAAFLLGGIINAFPIGLAIFYPGAAITRYTIAAAQMLMSGLLIHLTGGRIETHFHIFGSLAFLAFYRDWRVLIPATIVTCLDHFIRGIYWPESIYGVLTSSPWRTLEHVGWVLFEDVFLVVASIRSLREMRSIAMHTAQLETTNLIIEERVLERTAEVKASEERFRLLMDGVRDYAIIMLDTEGHVVSWNEGAKRVNGYTAEEALGQHFSLFIFKKIASKANPTNILSMRRNWAVWKRKGGECDRTAQNFGPTLFLRPCTMMPESCADFLK